MELEFSRGEIERCLSQAEDRLDAETVRLFRGYDYLHDAYIKSISWDYSQPVKVSCSIHLFQDVVPPACDLRIDMQDISACHSSFCRQLSINMEIYSLYLFRHPLGIELLCNTGGPLQFTIVAGQVRIRRA